MSKTPRERIPVLKSSKDQMGKEGKERGNMGAGSRREGDSLEVRG